MRTVLEINSDVNFALDKTDYKKAANLLNEEYDSLFEFYKRAKNPDAKKLLARCMQDSLAELLDVDEAVLFWKKMEE